MSSSKDSPREQARKAREAEAMRENLKKRKAFQQAQKSSKKDDALPYAEPHEVKVLPDNFLPPPSALVLNTQKLTTP